MMGQQPLRRFAASRRVCSQHPCNELVSAITAATTLAGFYQINMDTTLERCHRNRSSGARVNSTNGAASRRVCSRGQPVSAITAATTLAIFYQINWSLCPNDAIRRLLKMNKKRALFWLTAAGPSRNMNCLAASRRVCS